jgi:ABC-type multidrug transport system fused ATPase/permease subunit
MNYFQKEMKNIRADTAILSVLMLYFIVMGVNLPRYVAHIIDSPFGKLFLVIMVLMLFMRSVFLGILGMILAFDLIRQAEQQTGTAQERLFLPNDDDKGRVFTALNQFPDTIEEEIVRKMVPRVHE